MSLAFWCPSIVTVRLAMIFHVVFENTNYFYISRFVLEWNCSVLSRGERNLSIVNGLLELRICRQVTETLFRMKKLFLDNFSVSTRCKIAWNSCQDCLNSSRLPFALGSLYKILFIIPSPKPFEFLGIIKRVQVKNTSKTNKSFVYDYFAFVRNYQLN